MSIIKDAPIPSIGTEVVPMVPVVGSIVLPSSPARPLSPLIKIAPTKKEQQAQKDFEKDLAILGSEDSKAPAKRDEDIFWGGPLHGQICTHQPNGPRAKTDPNGLWADYYIKDTCPVDKHGTRVSGYHVYSSAPAFHSGDAGTTSMVKGLRGPQFRKNYYYCFFLDAGIIQADGGVLNEFSGVLSMG